MRDRPIPLARRILYYSIMIFMILLIFELVARAYYYQLLSRHPIAFVEMLRDMRRTAQTLGRRSDTAEKRLEKAEEMLRPDMPRSESREIGQEQLKADQAVFKPWVEFAFRDFHGKYLNVEDHVRRSAPDRSDSSGEKPIRIYFLGGSTMYGFSVTDEETIPSCFVRAYRRTHPGGRPIRIFNLGMPYYYSYQELIQLADLLFREEPPDMVIMLDGLNDCIESNDSYHREPAFAIGMDDIFRPGDKRDEKKQLQDFRDYPRDISIDSLSSSVSRQYLENIRNAHDLAGLFHIPLYCFWQPVCYYNYPNRDNDPICTHARSERFERIYPLVKARSAGLPYFFYLGDMLQNEKGLPFIDQIHYSPRFCQAIAEKMLSLVQL